MRVLSRCLLAVMLVRALGSGPLRAKRYTGRIPDLLLFIELPNGGEGLVIMKRSIVRAVAAVAMATTGLTPLASALAEVVNPPVSRSSLGLGATDTPTFLGLLLGASGINTSANASGGPLLVTTAGAGLQVTGNLGVIDLWNTTAHGTNLTSHLGEWTLGVDTGGWPADDGHFICKTAPATILGYYNQHDCIYDSPYIAGNLDGLAAATVATPGTGFTVNSTTFLAGGTPPNLTATATAPTASGTTLHLTVPDYLQVGMTVTDLTNSVIPAGTKVTAFNKGASTVTLSASVTGGGVLSNDSIRFATTAQLTVTDVRLVGLSLTGGGSGTSAGYVAGNVLTLVAVGGSGGATTTAGTVTVNTVDGGGGILTWTLTTGGDYTYTSLPTSFTVTGGAGSGATFGSPSWGAQTVVITPTSSDPTSVSGVGKYLFGQGPSGTVAQLGAGSSGGTGATFAVTSQPNPQTHGFGAAFGQPTQGYVNQIHVNKDATNGMGALEINMETSTGDAIHVGRNTLGGTGGLFRVYSNAAGSTNVAANSSSGQAATYTWLVNNSTVMTVAGFSGGVIRFTDGSNNKFIDYGDAGSQILQLGGGTNQLQIGATGAVSTAGNVTLSGAQINMTTLPTADPHVVGRLWNNAGVLTVSAG